MRQLPVPGQCGGQAQLYRLWGGELVGMVAYPTAIARRNLFAKALGQGAPGYSAVVRINKEVEIKDEHVISLPAPANSPPKK